MDNRLRISECAGRDERSMDIHEDDPVVDSHPK